MAVARKVVRVANPGRRGRYRLHSSARKKSLRSRSRNPAARRRRMTPKQIRHFGTKAQRAGLKRRLKGKRAHHARSRNPRPKVRVIYRYHNARPRKRKAAGHRRKKSNPALVVTLGSINPKRRKHVATKSRSRNRRKNPRRHTRRVARHTRRRSRSRALTVNPRRHIRRRRSQNVHHRRRTRRSSNPNPFRGKSTKSVLKIGGGVLIGVTITKMIPKYIPANIAGTLGGGGFMAVLVSAASAWAGGWLVSMVDPEVGEGALWGGIAQTISVALNAFLPQVGGTFSLGDLVSGNFVVPQNPIRSGMGVPMARIAGMGGAAAFPRAF